MTGLPKRYESLMQPSKRLYTELLLTSGSYDIRYRRSIYPKTLHACPGCSAPYIYAYVYVFNNKQNKYVNTCKSKNRYVYTHLCIFISAYCIPRYPYICISVYLHISIFLYLQIDLYVSMSIPISTSLYIFTSVSLCL